MKNLHCIDFPKKKIQKKRKKNELYQKVGKEWNLDELSLTNQNLQNNLNDFSYQQYNYMKELSKSQGWDFFTSKDSYSDFNDLLHDIIDYAVDEDYEEESSDEELEENY